MNERIQVHPDEQIEQGLLNPDFSIFLQEQKG